MSDSHPSKVSATTGRMKPSVYPCSTEYRTKVSRTNPTWWVLVMPTAEPSIPDSSIQGMPVISPLPLSEYHPQKA
jgi:hypothetical protein